MSSNDRIRNAMLYGMSPEQRKKFLRKERIAWLIALPFILAFIGGFFFYVWFVWSECLATNSFWFCSAALS